MEKSICTVCSSEFQEHSQHLYVGYGYCPNCVMQSNAIRAIRCLMRKTGSVISTATKKPDVE